MANRDSIQTQYTIDYDDFTAAATTENISLFTLRAGHVLEKVDVQHSTPFQGGAISAYTLSVGIAGDLAKYASAFDVFQQAGHDVGQHSVCEALESSTKPTDVRVAATSTGGNLSVATQGRCVIVVTTRKVF